MTMGSPSVNATGAAPPSSATARRLRKPELVPRDPAPAIGIAPPRRCPASRSGFGKDPRLPANGTNASCAFCQSGSIESLSAGCRPHDAVSPGPASAIAAIGLAGVGTRQRNGRPRLVVEIAADGNDDVGRVVAAAQEDEQELGVASARRGEDLRDDPARRQHRVGRGGHRQLQHVAAGQAHDSSRELSAASSRARPAASCSIPAARPSARARRASARGAPARLCRSRTVT